MDQRTTDEYNQRQDKLKESFRTGEYAEEHLAGCGLPVIIEDGKISLQRGYAEAARARIDKRMNR